MNTFVVICIVLGAANASLHAGIGLVGPAAPGVVLQGPSAKASIVGPDGSHNGGAAYGGTVVAAPKAGGAIAASVVPGAVLHGGVGVLSAAPVLSHGVGYVAAAPALGYGVGLVGAHGLGLAGAPLLGHGTGAVISGPSGTIATNGLHGVGAGWNGGWGGAWGGVHGGWEGAHGGWAGSGHEGQWIPDGTEHLYDDGSYKGDYNHGW